MPSKAQDQYRDDAWYLIESTNKWGEVDGYWITSPWVPSENELQVRYQGLEAFLGVTCSNVVTLNLSQDIRLRRRCPQNTEEERERIDRGMCVFELEARVDGKDTQYTFLHGFEETPKGLIGDDSGLLMDLQDGEKTITILVPLGIVQFARFTFPLRGYREARDTACNQ